MPTPLEALAFRQALSLRHESFGTDITSTRNLASDDRRALWRSAGLHAGVAIPLGLVLALPRGRFGRAALWPAGLAYLVCAAVLMISAVQLA